MYSLKQNEDSKMTKKLPRDVRSYNSDWDYYDDCEVEEVEERDDFDIFECEGF